MKIKIISKNGCTECERIKHLTKAQGLIYEEENMDLSPIERQFELKNIARRHRQLSMPMIFIDGEFTPTKDYELNHLGVE